MTKKAFLKDNIEVRSDAQYSIVEVKLFGHGFERSLINDKNTDFRWRNIKTF